MKIRRVVGKRRRRAGSRLIAAMCGIHLDREDQQRILVHRGLRPNGRRFAPARPWSHLPASLLAKTRDNIATERGVTPGRQRISEQELLELHRAMYEPGGGRA